MKYTSKFLAIIAISCMMISCGTKSSNTQNQESEELTAEEIEEYEGLIHETYVDLGLPSGTKWLSDDLGEYLAMSELDEYDSQLPSSTEYDELVKYCTITHEGGSVEITGPNGNSIHVNNLGGYNRKTDGSYAFNNSDVAYFWLRYHWNGIAYGQAMIAKTYHSTCVTPSHMPDKATVMLVSKE